MKVIRYSKEGFVPQQQTYHMKRVMYELHDFNIEECPEHLKYIVQKRHEKNTKFYSEHIDDFSDGIWCFVDGHKSNQALNHLKEKVPCWEADLPMDTECYDCNWEILTTISDSSIWFGGCYIPKRELYKLKNIRRKK